MLVKSVGTKPFTYIFMEDDESRIVVWFPRKHYNSYLEEVELHEGREETRYVFQKQRNDMAPHEKKQFCFKGEYIKKS